MYQVNFFSSNIKILRKQQGLRQAQIQDRLGITRTTWSNYENGISQPSIDNLINIARFFSVSVSDLLEKEMIIETGAGGRVQGTRMKHKPYRHPRTVKNISPLGDRGDMWEMTSTW